MNKSFVDTHRIRTYLNAFEKSLKIRVMDMLDRTADSVVGTARDSLEQQEQDIAASIKILRDDDEMQVTIESGHYQAKQVEFGSSKTPPRGILSNSLNATVVAGLSKFYKQ